MIPRERLIMGMIAVVYDCNGAWGVEIKS